jgi:hypothetical protein
MDWKPIASAPFDRDGMSRLASGLSFHTAKTQGGQSADQRSDIGVCGIETWQL